MRNTIRRSSGKTRIALDHAVLQFDGATHGVDDAAKFDKESVAHAFDDAPVMDGDGRIDEIAAQRPQARQRAILIRAGEPAKSHHICGEDRRELPYFAHYVRFQNPAPHVALRGRSRNTPPL